MQLPWPARAACGLLIAGNIGKALSQRSIFLESGQNAVVWSCNSTTISKPALGEQGAGGEEVDEDSARRSSTAGLSWSWLLRPSRVYTCDCPTEPVFSPQTQQIHEVGPCWWCKCHAVRGRKDHLITPGPVRSGEENHTNNALKREKTKNWYCFTAVFGSARPNSFCTWPQSVLLTKFDRVIDKDWRLTFHLWEETLLRNHPFD